MPRIPRDLSAKQLCRLLERLGYEVTRQQGIKIGTLNSILADVAGVIGVTKSELIDRLFLG
jgi:hypothetical protein